MTYISDNVGSILDSLPDIDEELGTTVEKQETPKEELASFEGIDPRLLLLSNSSCSILNKCARKFQLYRLNSLSASSETEEQTLTFDFGAAVGYGIQNILQGKSIESTLFDIFVSWKGDIEYINTKQSKSFWEALLAVQQFKTIKDSGYLNDYELVYWKGKPAVELSFRIKLPNGFMYRGFIDAVLKHSLTNAVVCLENKTTSYRNVNPAQYKNSGQALGYSVVLDHIFPKLSSYQVLYLVYTTPRKEYIELPFDKNGLQRAEWLTEKLMETKKIEMYEELDHYPKNGDFCYDFYRECDYLGLCTLSTERLIKPLTKSMLREIEEQESNYDFDLDFFDLVESQIERNK